MVYRSVSDIQDEYQLKTSVYKLKRNEYHEAVDAYEANKNRLYNIYLILFGLGAVGVWAGFWLFGGVTVAQAFNLALMYLLFGSLISMFIAAHIFVTIFNRIPDPNSAVFGCDKSERNRYVMGVKRELVESILEGRIMKVDWDKSTNHTWNMIVSLDEDKKAHEYYARFFVDDEEATIDVDVREFVAKH